MSGDGLPRIVPSRVSETPRCVDDVVWYLQHLSQPENVNRTTLKEAARAFDAFAKSALEDAGYVPSPASVARIVGESRTHYADAVAGRKCSTQRIFSWWARWVLAFTPEESLPFPRCDVVKNPHLPRLKSREEASAESQQPKPLSEQALSTIAKYGRIVSPAVPQRAAPPGTDEEIP